MADPGNKAPVANDDEHLGKLLKKELASAPREIAEEWWLPAVGIGALALAIAVGMLIWGAKIETPSVTDGKYRNSQACSQVLKQLDENNPLGRMSLSFSGEAQKAKDACEKDQLKSSLRVLGSLLAVIAIPWTAGFAYFGYKHEIKPLRERDMHSRQGKDS